MKDETGSIGTQLSSLGASRGATIQDIVTATSIKPPPQPSKFSLNQSTDFRQRLPNISVVPSLQEKNDAFSLKRMVSNILDYSPQLKVRKEGLEIEKVVKTVTQNPERAPRSKKAILRMGDQLWEISKFLLLLYILSITMIFQDLVLPQTGINDTHRRSRGEFHANFVFEGEYTDLLLIFDRIGFKLAFILALLYLNSKFLLSKNVSSLRYKLQKEVGSATYCASDYLSKFLFRISRLFAILTCRKQMALQLMISENCSSQSQEDLEHILNDQRSDYLNQVLLQGARVKGNSNSVITISKPSPFLDQLNCQGGGKGAVQNSAIAQSQNNNPDEDRFSNIFDVNSSRQANKSSGSLNSRVKAQEENIKSYFGLTQKISQQSSHNGNSLQLSPSVSNNESVGFSHFRSATPIEAAQYINIEQLSHSTSPAHCINNLQVPNATAKSRFYDQKFAVGQAGYATAIGGHQSYQQINHGGGTHPSGQNQDNFEGLAISSIQYQKQSNGGAGGQSHLLPPISSQQRQTNTFGVNQQITIVSPSRQQYIEDRISEKNEDSHSQRHSVTQDSEPDSFFHQDTKAEGTPRKEHSREYSIHLNDNLLVNPFAFPMQTEQINLQPSFSIVQHRSPAPKNFKRMQLRDFQKFHSQEHSEGQLQALNRLNNKANLTDSRRSSQLNPRPPFPYVNQPSMNSLDIQSQINNRFVKQASYQTIGTAKSQIELMPIGSHNGLSSANEFTINDMNQQTSRQTQNFPQQNMNTGQIDSFRSSKMSSSPTFTNTFLAEGFQQDQSQKFKIDKQDNHKGSKAQSSSQSNNMPTGGLNHLSIALSQPNMKKVHSNALPSMGSHNFMQRSDTSNDLKLANCSENEAGERERAYSLEKEKRDQAELEEIQFSLDIFGSCFIVLFIVLLVYLRSQYLESNIIFQLCIYRSISFYCKQLIQNHKIGYALMIFFFCCLQYPDGKSVNKYQFCLHVALSTIFLVSFALLDNKFSQKSSANLVVQGKDQKTEEDGEDGGQLQINHSKEKIEQIIKSDGHLKNLVQLIPYGIAVLNLEDVSHFNQPFAKVLGVRKQRQVLEALNKFQRKVKDDSGGNSHTHSHHNRRTSHHHSNNHLTFEKLNQSQKSKRRQQQQQIVHSNLKEDLEYILKNKDLVFAKTQNIFDIYYIEKDEQQFSRQNTSRSPRPKSLMNSITGAGGGNSHNHDQSSQVSNQARKVYSISISPIKWGEKECLLLTVKDITHEKIIDQKQLMDKLKNMIFKSFTHELKTPLNGIIMTVETANFIAKTIINKLRNANGNGGARALREKNLEDVANQSKQLHKQLKNMESCSYVLKNIMHDFFDYHQLQTNELTLNVKEFDVAQCLKEIKRIVKYQMKFPDKVAFQHRLEFQNPGGLFLGAESRFDQMRGSAKMICDRDRLMQILLNLLMNSIKFTTKGFISLKVHVMQHNNPPIIKFKVKDSGIGIEEERQPYIFNLFEKNESSNLNTIIKSKNKSARMGLPISQNLCMMMGGHISVKSKVGVGSTFKFVLPLNAYEGLITSRAGADESQRHRSTYNDRQFDSHCTQKTIEFASMLEHALNKDNMLSAELDLSRTQLAATPHEGNNNFSHLTKTSGLNNFATGSRNLKGDASPGSRMAKPVKRAKDQDELTDHLSQDDPNQLQHQNTLGGGSIGQGPQGSIYGGSGNLDGNQNLQPRQKKSREMIYEEDEDEIADQDLDEGLDLDEDSEEERDEFDDDDRISGISGSDSEEEVKLFRKRKSKIKQSSRDLIFESNKKMGQFEFFFNPSSPNNKTHLIQKTHTAYLDEESKHVPRLQHSHSFIDSYGEKSQSNGFNSYHSGSKQSSLHKLPHQNPNLILTLGPSNSQSTHPLRSNNNTVTNLSNPLIQQSNQGGFLQMHQVNQSLININKQENIGQSSHPNHQKVSEITVKNMIGEGAGKQSNSVTSSIPSFVLEPKSQNNNDAGKSHEFLLTSRSSFDTENMEEEGVDPKLKLKSPHSKQARDKNLNKQTQQQFSSFQDAAVSSNVFQEETKTPKETLAQAAQRRQGRASHHVENLDESAGNSFYMKFRDANFSFAKDDIEQYKRLSSGGNPQVNQDINFDQLLLGSNQDYSQKLLQISSFNQMHQDSVQETPNMFSQGVKGISTFGNAEASQKYLKVESIVNYQPQFVSQKNTMSLEEQKLEETKDEKMKQDRPRDSQLKHEFSFHLPKKNKNESFVSGESFNMIKMGKGFQESSDESQQQILKTQTASQYGIVNTPYHQSSESSQAYQNFMNQRRTANFNIYDVDEQKAISQESGLYILPQLSRNQSSDLQIGNQLAVSSSSFLQHQVSDGKNFEVPTIPIKEEARGEECDEDDIQESDPNQFDEDCAIESERDFKDQGLREFSTKPAKNQDGAAKSIVQESLIINSASRRVQMGSINNFNGLEKRGSMREFIDLPNESQTNIRMDFDKGQIINFQHKHNQESLMNIGGNFDDLDSCAYSAAANSNRFIQDTQNDEQCSMQSSYRSMRRGGGGGGTGRIKGKPSKMNTFGQAQDQVNQKKNSGINLGASHGDSLKNGGDSSKHALLNPSNYLMFGQKEYFPMEGRPGARPNFPLEMAQGRARSSTCAQPSTKNDTVAEVKESGEVKRQKFFKLDSFQSFAPGNSSHNLLEVTKKRSQQVKESENSISFSFKPPPGLDSPQSVVNIPADLSQPAGPLHSQTLGVSNSLPLGKSSFSYNKVQTLDPGNLKAQDTEMGRSNSGGGQLGDFLSIKPRREFQTPSFQESEQKPEAKEITEVITMKISKRDGSSNRQMNKSIVSPPKNEEKDQTNCEEEDQTNKNIRNHYQGQQRQVSFNDPQGRSIQATIKENLVHKYGSLDPSEVNQIQEGNIILTDMGSMVHQNSSYNIMLNNEIRKLSINSTNRMINSSQQNISLSQHFHTAADEVQNQDHYNFNLEEQKLEHLQTQQNQGQSPTSNRRRSLIEQEEEEKLQRIEKQKKNDSMYESPKSSDKLRGALKVRIETQKDQSEQFNPQDQGSPHRCPQIMVVDDVQMNRYAIEQMLLLIFGIKVLQAENGQECIDILQQYYREKSCSCEGIRLILMDLEMPVMDGITAAVRLRRIMSGNARDPRGIPEIPIVALTAYLDEKENCLRAGMKGFMVKPTSKTELADILSKYRIRAQVEFS